MAKWLALGIAVLVALYSGYWFFGSAAVEREARRLIEDAQEAGWQFGDGALNTRGFPSRFDTTLQPVEITSPNGQFAWSAPFVQVFSLSYRPNHVIVVWPERQSLRLGDLDLDVTSTDMRASGVFSLSGENALSRVTAEATGLLAEGSSSISMEHVLLALRQAEESDTDYDFFASGAAWTLGALEIGSLEIDSTVTLTEPLDSSLSDRLQVAGIDLRRFDLAFGQGRMSLDGRIAPDQGGFPAGQLNLVIHEPEALLSRLDALGVLSNEARQATETFLGGLTPREDGGYAMTLRLVEGTVLLGGAPVLSVPRIAEPAR